MSVLVPVESLPSMKPINLNIYYCETITYFFGQQTMNCLSVRKSYKSIRLEDKTMIKKSLESNINTRKQKNEQRGLSMVKSL